MVSLIIEEFESSKNCDVCYFCNEKFNYIDVSILVR